MLRVLLKEGLGSLARFHLGVAEQCGNARVGAAPPALSAEGRQLEHAALVARGFAGGRLLQDEFDQAELVAHRVEASLAPVGDVGHDEVVPAVSGEDRRDVDVVARYAAHHALVVAVLHSRVGDQQDVLVAGVDVLQAVVGLLDRGIEDRAADGLHAADGAVDLDLVGCRLHRHRPVLGAVELDDPDTVVGLQAAHGDPRDLLGEFDARSGHRTGGVDDDGEANARIDLLLLAGNLDRQHVGDGRAVVAAVRKGRSAAAGKHANPVVLNGSDETALGFYGEKARGRIIEHDDFEIGEVEPVADAVGRHAGQIEPDAEQGLQAVDGPTLPIADMEYAQGILNGDNAVQPVVGRILVRFGRHAECRGDVEEPGPAGFELDPDGTPGFAIEWPHIAENLVVAQEHDFEFRTGAHHVDRDADGLSGPRGTRLKIDQKRVFVRPELHRVHGNLALKYLGERPSPVTVRTASVGDQHHGTAESYGY